MSQVRPPPGKSRHRDVDDFLRRLDVLLWDSAAAAEYAEIRSDLEGRGTADLLE